MTVDVFRETRERVGVPDAARFYGYTPNRSGFICCPFHQEKTASLKLYPTSFHCFGCGAGGSVIDFTAQLFGLDALGAVKKLNTDFALNLPLDHHEPTREERQAAQRRAELTDAYNSFEAWRADFICKLNAVFRMAHQMDVTDLDKLIDREAVALQIQAEVEYLADLLEGGTPEQQAKIYRERREYEWIGSLLKG